ncbi:hypothetical protein D3C73_1037370 [compost metagenome]
MRSDGNAGGTGLQVEQRGALLAVRRYQPAVHAVAGNDVALFTVQHKCAFAYRDADAKDARGFAGFQLAFGFLPGQSDDACAGAQVLQQRVAQRRSWHGVDARQQRGGQHAGAHQRLGQLCAAGFLDHRCHGVPPQAQPAR